MTRTILRRKWFMAVAVAVAVAGVGIPLAIGGMNAFPIFPTPEDVAGEPVPLESPVVIASASLNSDVPWALRSHQSDSGLCLEVVVSGAEPSAGGGCGFGIGADRAISFARRHLASADTTWIFGPTANAVKEVSVALDDGRKIDVETLSAPGFEVRFYVTTFPGTVGVRSISAKDGRGTTLETLPIASPVPPKP